MIRPVVVSFVIIVLFPCLLDAGEPEMRWGVVPHEYLFMERFEPDTNASAVILFDRGEVTVEDDLFIRFTRHRRIKILSSDGYSWGTHTIPYRSEGRTQRVRNIEGQTINLNEDGSVSRHELESDAIFDEDVDGRHNRIQFTLPALKPGSIVEYTYTVLSNHPMYFPDWRFQTGEPVLWSEFRAKVPNMLRYVIVIEGTHRMYKREQNAYLGRNEFYSGQELRWVMKDLPAIRREPYMATVNDYRAKIRFQLAVVHYPGRYPVQVLHTWEEIIDILLGNSFYGRDMNGPRQVRRLVRELTEGIEDPVEKMHTIYRYVQNTIVWNGRYSVVPSERLRTVIDENRGNSADIALLLTAMLRSADIEADMIILSTRRNGKIQNAYPLVDQFNHAITRAKAGGTYHLLDATDPYIPIGILPVQSMNEVGLLVKKGSVNWISIGAIDRYTHRVYARMDLDSTGILTGEIRFEDTGYSAHNKRRELADNDEETHVRFLLGDEYAVFDVERYSIDNSDDIGKPLMTTLDIASSTYAYAAGEHIYLNPFVSGRIRENNLRLKERTFPVEFVYGREFSLAVNMTIPDGYEILELPSEVTIRLRQNGGQYRRVLREIDGVVQIRRLLEINQVYFEPREYERLRNFFERVVAYDSEQIVLRRIGYETDAAAGN